MDQPVFIVNSGMLGGMTEKLRQAVTSRDDVVIVDRLPAFADSDDPYFNPRKAEPSPEQIARATWNATIDAKKAERNERRGK